MALVKQISLKNLLLLLVLCIKQGSFDELTAVPVVMWHGMGKD